MKRRDVQIKFSPGHHKERDLKDIWYALDYQDRRINKLIDENQEYKDRLKYTEKRLDVEIKDIKKQISGLQNNMESIIDIVKVFQSQFEQLKKATKARATSPGSPKFSTGVSTRSSNKKQVSFNTRVKKKVRKSKPAVHQAALTDTESNKMHDLLKKNCPNLKTKKNFYANKSKSKSISSSGLKNKFKPNTFKNQSVSRSPHRDDSHSTTSRNKKKSTIGSAERWKSQALKNSVETLSISSEKPKAAYFKNTLDSHNKIRSGGTKATKHPQKATPVQNVKLYTRGDSSSTNEIEEQLPQMMKFFDSKVPGNVMKYKLDLSGSKVKPQKPARMTWTK
uniref:Uncharacterized protein n=1 Tax=Euplotes crassus TaxID=5936 RepID=A0A7S3KQ65_EUPCR|mmetsp:Transcript_3944/g.3701  ORF Transcript_3944/g.3701 Transcript_3944/m.3701 type:complete len:336 (+) Transcript_3944:170-1177(+)